MSKPTMSIFTPTYNRAHLLPVLYHSLVEQSCRDFQWLLVDDGSQDDTAAVVDRFRAEGLVDIVYIRKENGGKHTAFNMAVANCDTELFTCVDSDDSLYPDAVEKILRVWDPVKEDPKVAGVVSPMDIGGHSKFYNPPKTSSLMDLYSKGQLVGETTLTYRTDVLRQFPFPQIPGERFLSECVVFHRIDREYVLAINESYASVGAYQDDGLTANMLQIQWNNPVSTLIMYRTLAAYETNRKVAIKGYGSYLGWRMTRKLAPWTQFPVPVSTKLAGSLLAIPYYLKYKHQGKSLNQQ